MGIRDIYKFVDTGNGLCLIELKSIVHNVEVGHKKQNDMSAAVVRQRNRMLKKFASMNRLVCISKATKSRYLLDRDDFIMIIDMLAELSSNYGGAYQQFKLEEDYVLIEKELSTIADRSDPELAKFIRIGNPKTILESTKKNKNPGTIQSEPPSKRQRIEEERLVECTVIDRKEQIESLKDSNSPCDPSGSNADDDDTESVEYESPIERDKLSNEPCTIIAPVHYNGPTGCQSTVELKNSISTTNEPINNIPVSHEKDNSTNLATDSHSPAETTITLSTRSYNLPLFTNTCSDGKPFERILSNIVLGTLRDCSGLKIFVRQYPTVGERKPILELHSNTTDIFNLMVRQQEETTYFGPNEPNKYYLFRQCHLVFPGEIPSRDGIKQISKGEKVTHYIVSNTVLRRAIQFIMDISRERMIEFQFYDAKDSIVTVDQMDEKLVDYFDVTCHCLSKESIQRFLVESTRIRMVLDHSVQDWLINHHNK